LGTLRARTGKSSVAAARSPDLLSAAGVHCRRAGSAREDGAGWTRHRRCRHALPARSGSKVDQWVNMRISGRRSPHPKFHGEQLRRHALRRACWQDAAHVWRTLHKQVPLLHLVTAMLMPMGSQDAHGWLLAAPLGLPRSPAAERQLTPSTIVAAQLANRARQSSCLPGPLVRDGSAPRSWPSAAPLQLMSVLYSLSTCRVL